MSILRCGFVIFSEKFCGFHCTCFRRRFSTACCDTVRAHINFCRSRIVFFHFSDFIFENLCFIISACCKIHFSLTLCKLFHILFRKIRISFIFVRGFKIHQFICRNGIFKRCQLHIYYRSHIFWSFGFIFNCCYCNILEHFCFLLVCKCNDFQLEFF